MIHKCHLLLTMNDNTLFLNNIYNVLYLLGVAENQAPDCCAKFVKLLKGFLSKYCCLFR